MSHPTSHTVQFELIRLSNEKCYVSDGFEEQQAQETW